MLQGYMIPGYVRVPIGFILKNCFGEGKPCVKLPKILFFFPVHYFCGKVDPPNPPWKPKRFLKELMILTHMERLEFIPCWWPYELDCDLIGLIGLQTLAEEVTFQNGLGSKFTSVVSLSYSYTLPPI